MNSKRYNRAVGVAEFIIEGHTISQTMEEFRISKDTIQRDLKYLGENDYGINGKRNLELYKKAKIQLHSHHISPKSNIK